MGAFQSVVGGVEVVVLGGSEVGAFQVGVLEFAVAQIAVGESAAREVGVKKVGVVDLAILEPGAFDVQAAEIAQLDAAFRERQFYQKGADFAKNDSQQFAALKLHSLESAIINLGVGKVAGAEFAAGEQHAAEPAAGKIAFFKFAFKKFLVAQVLFCARNFGEFLIFKDRVFEFHPRNCMLKLLADAGLAREHFYGLLH